MASTSPALSANPFFLLDEESSTTVAYRTPPAEKVSPTKKLLKIPRPSKLPANSNIDSKVPEILNQLPSNNTISIIAICDTQKNTGKKKRRNEITHPTKTKDEKVDRKPRSTYTTGNRSKKDGAGKFNTGKVNEVADRVEHLVTASDHPLSAEEIIIQVEAGEIIEDTIIANSVTPQEEAQEQRQLEDEKIMTLAEYKRLLASQTKAAITAQNVRKAGEGVDESVFKSAVEKKKEPQPTATRALKSSLQADRDDKKVPIILNINVGLAAKHIHASTSKPANKNYEPDKHHDRVPQKTFDVSDMTAFPKLA